MAISLVKYGSICNINMVNTHAKKSDSVIKIMLITPAYVSFKNYTTLLVFPQSSIALLNTPGNG